MSTYDETLKMSTYDETLKEEERLRREKINTRQRKNRIARGPELIRKENERNAKYKEKKARDHSEAMEFFHDEDFSNLVQMPHHLPANPVVYENTELAVSFPTNEGRSCLPATDFGVAPSRHENHYLAPDGSESRDNHASPTIDSRSASPKNKSYSQETSRYNPAESGRHHSTGSGRHTSMRHTPPATVSDPAPPAQGHNYPVNTTSYASGEPIVEYKNATDGELSVPNFVFHDPQQYNSRYQ